MATNSCSNGKTTQQNARNIIAKHNRKNAQKAIAKFQNLITNKPKQGNKTIFKNSDNYSTNFSEKRSFVKTQCE